MMIVPWQGLKALAEERLGAALAGANGGSSSSMSFASQLSSSDLSSTSFSGSSGSFSGWQTFRQDPAPAPVPGSANSIWRMNPPGVGSNFIPAATHQKPKPSASPPQYPGVVSTQDLASLARLQYQLYQDTLRRYKKR